VNCFLLPCSSSLPPCLPAPRRFLDRATCSEALSEFIDEGELTALLRRKDAVLAHFDRLVREAGYERVVMEEPATLPPPL
jgi:hypothetical protein